MDEQTQCYASEVTPIVELTTLAELDAALAASAERPLVLFKHSTRCHVSGPALAEFEELAAGMDSNAVSLALVKVVEHRDVSTFVANALKVRHESPQAILVASGVAVWHDSHWNVTAGHLRDALAALSR